MFRWFAVVVAGDQVVSVNGESVMCKSYAQVVQMIQRSGPTLELMVMPKEHDVLQQVRADCISCQCSHDHIVLLSCLPE